MTARSKRSRSALPDDKTPLRDLYRQTNDKAIYALVKSFLSAAKAALWDAAPENSYIIRTVGIQAILDVLFLMADPAVAAKKLSEAFFAPVLQQAANIDFSQDFFQASGKGRVRIKHTLAVAMGLESIDDVPVSDREQYAALTANQ